MRADEISATAKSDPLICLFGETLLAKHKRQQIANIVSNRMREMARMLMVIKTLEEGIRSFFDVLKPEMFQPLIFAVKDISGYDVVKKEFRAPSLALHMGTNIKIMCDVAYKIVLEKRILPNINWLKNSEKKNEIKDLKKLVEAHWCNELASLALKNIKEKQWGNPKQLPLSSDILALQTYIDAQSVDCYDKLTNNIDIKTNYKILIECVLAQTIIFNRKRVGDVQFLKVETYMKDDNHLDQEAFTESLTTVEKIISKQFKRVVTGGKGSRPVPILFSKRTQKYISCLLKIRDMTDFIPKSNPYIFAVPGSKEWISGAHVIRRLAIKCGAKHPQLFTSTRFRKHIATTLQLMTMQPHKIEQVATFMGHTRKTHAQFYRLPQDIFQTAKVAKVLLLLEKGKGKVFKGKCLSEIEIEEEASILESSDDDAPTK
ncbi:uncharacterized protein LOC132697593 [Cylas formicarius]|uniref:uncharacterized protein LOC132697593 n=1 Tax=Cylas formicarius TaxID=197179 RepID=UPI002958689A|nr:uncharacterized protein LOC132697593 [Cylas formicarius]